MDELEHHSVVCNFLPCVELPQAIRDHSVRNRNQFEEKYYYCRSINIKMDTNNLWVQTQICLAPNMICNSPVLETILHYLASSWNISIRYQQYLHIKCYVRQVNSSYFTFTYSIPSINLIYNIFLHYGQPSILFL